MHRKSSGDEFLLEAANRERKIIASELHDTLCQSLAALSLRTSSAIRRGRAGKEITIPELEAIGNQLSQAMDQCRSLMDFEVIESQPDRLPAKIREFIGLFGDRIDCQLRIDPHLQFSSAKIAHFYYRVVREVIGDCARHPASPRLKIALEQTSSHHSLEISCAGLEPKLWRRLVTGDTFLPRSCQMLEGLWKIRGLTVRCLFSVGPDTGIPRL